MFVACCFFYDDINDLPDNIRSSVRLFADDCVLYRNINFIQFRTVCPCKKTSLA